MKPRGLRDLDACKNIYKHSYTSRHVQTFNFLCADKHTQMQTHAKFFSYILCPSCYMFRPWVSLPANPLSHVGSFLRSRNTVGTQSIISAIPPTVLRTSISLESLPWFLDMSYWESSWVYNGLYLVLTACIWPKVNAVESQTSWWKARSCKDVNANAHGHMQTHPDTRRWKTNTDACWQTQGKQCRRT